MEVGECVCGWGGGWVCVGVCGCVCVCMCVCVCVCVCVCPGVVLRRVFAAVRCGRADFDYYGYKIHDPLVCHAFLSFKNTYFRELAKANHDGKREKKGGQEKERKNNHH